MPEFSIPSLSALQDVKVPSDVEDSLLKLNSTIPSLDALREKLESLIEKPFNLLKAEINETRLELASSFNSSLLPTPSLASLSAQNAQQLEQELCSNIDTSLVDNVATSLRKLSDISIGVMIGVLILVWLALCIWEWRRWKTMKDTVDLVEHEWARDNYQMRDGNQAWRVVSIVENLMIEKYGSPVLRRLWSSDRARTNVRWYCKSPLCPHSNLTYHKWITKLTSV